MTTTLAPSEDSLRDLPQNDTRRLTWRLPAARLLVPALLVPALLLATLAFRTLGFLPAVIDTDEGLYMVQAREWLRGGWPLVAVWDMHPIGAPALIALAMTVFGESVGAVRLLGAITVALAAGALVAAVRAAGAPLRLGLGAGLIYIAHSVRLGGQATNTEILFAPLVVAAIALGIRSASLALREKQVPRWRDLVAMGLAIGLALAIKPVAAPEGCLAFVLLAFPAWWCGLLPWRRGLTMAAAYAGLCALPTLLFGLAYLLQGEFAAFLDGSFLAPFRYSHGRLGGAAAVQQVLVTVLTLLWPCLLALVALARWLPRAGPGGLLARVGLLWFATGSLAILAPGFFFPHYFLIWLPPLSLLAALGCWRLARFMPLCRRGLAFGFLVAVVAVGSWRADATARIERGIGLFTPDPVRQVSAAIAAELPPGEPIFIANYHPVVYVLARAGLPTRYAFPAHVTGHFGGVADIDMDAEVARILASRPRFVVVDRGWWHTIRPGAAAIISASLQADYELAGTVPEERGPVELWRPR